MTGMSAYAAAKIVNEWIKELGVEKVLPPQMIYTYTKKGYITSNEVDGKRLVEESDLKVWFEKKYAPKNLGVKVEETVVDENQLDLFESDQS